jgi:ubiquinone/menaquinone biosynthesis C-methylase UbiE
MTIKQIWADRFKQESPEEIVFGRFIGKLVLNSVGKERMEKYFSESGRYIWKGKKVEKGMLILDEGVGPLARFTIPFAESGAHVIALDISKRSLKEAEKRVKGNKLNNVDFILADVRNLPFKDEIFDVSFCRATLLHLPNREEIKISLKEMGRVVNKTGRIYFDFENYINPINWLQLIGTKILHAFGISKPPHHSFNYFSLVRTIKSAGLDIEDMETAFSFNIALFLVPPFSILRMNKAWECFGKWLSENADKNTFLRVIGFYWYVKAKK